MILALIRGVASPSVSLSDVLSSGVQIDPHEAVAVVLELMSHLDQKSDGDAGTPAAAPTLETVHLTPDATVRCDSCAGTPDVADIGRLLNAMLPTEGKVPGALRYTIARARLDVDAPPFASLEDFASALKRFEKGRREEVMSALYALASVSQLNPGRPESPTLPSASPVAPAVPVAPAAPVRSSRVPAMPVVPVDRRRNMPSPTELRKRLREADRELYEARLRREPAPAPPPIARERPAVRERPVIRERPIAPERPIVPERPVARELPPPIRAIRPPPPRSSMPRQIAAVVAAVALGASFFAGYALYSPERDVPPAVGSTGTVSSPSPSDDERGREPSQPSAPAASPVLEERTLTGAALTRGVPGPAFSPSFTRDGTTLLFHTGRTDDARSALMSEPVPPGGSMIPILDDGARNYHVQASPDGTRLAFDSDRDGERGVYVADRGGSNARRVSGSGYAAVPTWAPDGQRLTFVRAEEGNSRVWNLWILTLATGEIRRLTDFDFGQTWGASWLPDGRRICYSHEDRLMVVDVDNGRWRRYRSPVAGSLVRTPAVSPDGSQVIFQVAQSGAWLLDFETGSMRQVLDDRSAEEFSWSPDGRSVAFHSRRAGEWDIWLMAAS